MIELEKIADLHKHLSEQRKQGAKIGFVPTMGALHEGHIALIEQAKLACDFVLCTVYVNPLQFNNPEDFENYPNRLDSDRNALIKAGCDLLYLPIQKELFPENPPLNYPLGNLGKVMEGTYRPGHFQGMVSVVERFLNVIEPQVAYFGEKDYQQFALIRWLVEWRNLPIKIEACPTVRNAKGLALSSRNLRLNAEDVQRASELYKTMQWCKSVLPGRSVKQVLEEARGHLKQIFDLEYLEIASEKELEIMEEWDQSKGPRIFVAANLSGIRLIDNLGLID